MKYIDPTGEKANLEIQIDYESEKGRVLRVNRKLIEGINSAYKVIKKATYNPLEWYWINILQIKYDKMLIEINKQIDESNSKKAALEKAKSLRETINTSCAALKKEEERKEEREQKRQVELNEAKIKEEKKKRRNMRIDAEIWEFRTKTAHTEYWKKARKRMNTFIPDVIK